MGGRQRTTIFMTKEKARPGEKQAKEKQ